MFDLKKYPHLLKKAVLLFMIGSKAAYSETSELPIESSSGEEIEVRGDLHFTSGNYDGRLGLANIFIVGDTNHWFVQVGGLREWPIRLSEGGLAIGHRWLLQGNSPDQDSFVGLFMSTHSKAMLSGRWSVDGGVEYASKSLQATFNAYGISTSYEPVSPYKEEAAGGMSAKFSSYYFQKMQPWGRINPVVFGALTHVIKEGQPNIWGINRGIGLRWEYRYYADIAVELKFAWDNLKKPGKILGSTLEGGCQITLSGRSESDRSYAINRLREMPQRYKPDYDIKRDHSHVKSAETQQPAVEKEDLRGRTVSPTGSGKRVTRVDSNGSPQPSKVPSGKSGEAKEELPKGRISAWVNGLRPEQQTPSVPSQPFTSKERKELQGNHPFQSDKIPPRRKSDAGLDCDVFSKDLPPLRPNSAGSNRKYSDKLEQNLKRLKNTLPTVISGIPVESGQPAGNKPDTGNHQSYAAAARNGVNHTDQPPQEANRPGTSHSGHGNNRPNGHSRKPSSVDSQSVEDKRAAVKRQKEADDRRSQPKSGIPTPKAKVIQNRRTPQSARSKA